MCSKNKEEVICIGFMKLLRAHDVLKNMEGVNARGGLPRMHEEGTTITYKILKADKTCL